jgi:hypothetical protein
MKRFLQVEPSMTSVRMTEELHVASSARLAIANQFTCLTPCSIVSLCRQIVSIVVVGHVFPQCLWFRLFLRYKLSLSNSASMSSNLFIKCAEAC